MEQYYDNKVELNGSIIGGQLIPGFLTQLKSWNKIQKNLKFQKNMIFRSKIFNNYRRSDLKGVINSLTGVINNLFNPEKDILVICGGTLNPHKITKDSKENIKGSI